MSDSNKPAYSTSFLSVPIQHAMSTKGQENQNEKEERETHNAPKQVPHQIGDVQELLSSMYINLVGVKSSIDALSNAETDKHAIDRLNNLIDQVGAHIIKNIPEELDNLLI